MVASATRGERDHLWLLNSSAQHIKYTFLGHKQQLSVSEHDGVRTSLAFGLYTGWGLRIRVGRNNRRRRDHLIAVVFQIAVIPQGREIADIDMDRCALRI